MIKNPFSSVKKQKAGIEQKKNAKESYRGKRRKISVISIKIVVLGLIILATVLKGVTGFITDLLWFNEIGYISVFLKKLITLLQFGIPLFIIITLLMNLYLRRVKADYFNKIVSHENTDVKRLNRWTNAISIVFGIVMSCFFISDLWFEFLQFLNSTKFNIKDPIFGFDVSFYIFKLEFLQHLNSKFIWLIVAFVLVTVAYYLILLIMHSPDKYDEDEAEPYEDDYYKNYKGPFPGDENNPLNKIFVLLNGASKPRKYLSNTNFKELMGIAVHRLSILVFVLFLMLGVHFFLKQFDTLHAHTGVVYGAGFTDVTIDLWMFRILTVLSLLGAFLSVYFIRKKSFKKVFVVPGLMMAVILIGIGLGLVVQNMVVAPDEINKEKKYLARNIEYTQYAYDIDNVTVKPFEAKNDLTAADLLNNSATISNIRINDYKPVETFYNQTQSIRQYYKFKDIDVDRYDIDGKYTQTYMSLREIDESKISDTWLNRHLKYTHGYGLALSRVDQITANGQPDVLIKNIPPESSIKNIKIDRPEVYFGELSNDYIIVNTSEEEFDYPNGQSNKYTKYKGKAGIKLNWFNRIMFALRENSLKLLVSTNVKSDSRIIINRNVTDRVHKIMPYLKFEDDPYSVTVNGRIYWIMDAYTTSSYYPYSEPFSKEEGTNYIRNSVKVVIDAYNGDTSFYVVDKTDPIAKTFQKIYPKLFKSVETMPKELKKHLRYPNSMVKVQAEVYARYHMNDVKVFYQNEDLWDIAHEIYGTSEKEMKPNYYIAKLPGEEKSEFISVLPYTPKSKQNMTALLVARNDGKHYGEILVYQFPKNKTVYGPMQIEAQIDQNTEISKEFSLWSQAGSKYSRGNLFVVPIGHSLLYVEPIYLEASNSAIPEVKRVVVAYGDKIAYKPTLKEALESLFGEGTGVDEDNDGKNTGSNPPDKNGAKKPSSEISLYIDQAQAAYDEGQKALKDGDWTAYGEAMKKLKDALDHMGNK